MQRYIVKAESLTECGIWFGEQRLEEVIEFEYLGAALCKQGWRERTVKGRQVIGVAQIFIIEY